MKAFTSVFALSAKETLLKILGILAVMTCAEIGVFYKTLSSAKKPLPLLGELTGKTILGFTFYYLCFAAAFMAILLVLFTIGKSRGSCNPGYTLARLSIGRRAIAAAAALYTGCILILLWAIQVSIFLLFVKLYMEENADYPYEPVLFLFNYEYSFFHGLFSHGVFYNHISNMLMIIGISLAVGADAVFKGLTLQKGVALILSAVFLIALPKEEYGGIGIDYVTGIVLIFIYGQNYIGKPSPLIIDEEPPTLNQQVVRGR